MNCPCGKNEKYENCCGRFIENEELPETPEELMRSRYTAFALKKIQYLQETHDPQKAENFDFAENKNWAEQATFTRLEVLHSESSGNKGQVEFKAHYQIDGEEHIHHEISKFRQQAGQWYYREGRMIPSKVKS